MNRWAEVTSLLGSVIADSLIVLTVAVGILTLLDLLLSEKQKARLADRTVYLWTWLDDMKRNSFLDWLRRARRWIVGTGLLLGTCYVVWAVLKRDPNSPQDVSFLFFLGLLLLASVWIGLQIINLTLNTRTLFGAFLRATLFVCLLLAPIAGIVAFANYFGELLLPDETATLLQMIWVIFFITTTLFTALILIFWAVIAVPLAFATALTIILCVMEFVVCRIAEHPKGPIFAVSALVFGVGEPPRVCRRLQL